MWLSGHLYDSGDNRESGGASRKWFMCSVSDIYLRRTWIMPQEHLFLLELDNQSRWRCLRSNCLRPSKTNPIEGTQINTMCTLAVAHIQKPLAPQLQHSACRVSWVSASPDTGGWVSSLFHVGFKCKPPWAPMTIRLMAWGDPAYSGGIPFQGSWGWIPSSLQWKKKGLPAPLQVMVKPLWVLHSICGLPQFSELSTGPNCPILTSHHHPETASVKCFDGAGFWKVPWATANKITSKIELGCLTSQNVLLRHLKYCLLHSPAPPRHPKRSSFSYSVCTFPAWDISFYFSLMLLSIPQGEC